MSEDLEDTAGNVSVDKKTIKNLRFADGIDAIEESQELESIVEINKFIKLHPFQSLYIHLLHCLLNKGDTKYTT